MNVLTRPWRHIFDYKGRSTRREFWLFVFLFYVVLIGLGIVLALIGTAAGASLEADGSVFAMAASLLPLLWMLACLPAFLALAVRRLHDHDKTGWFFLLSWIPLVGWIFFLIMMLTPGSEEYNSYGPNPRYADPLDDTAEVFA
ncbi:MAG TPA: DUF805 domain-containing protein [Allosphingosinicella sp.]|jgi:uncharacterized membrane protein YhaH (DUF805 family)